MVNYIIVKFKGKEFNLIQINKNAKCPHCKCYLESIYKDVFNGYCTMKETFLKCNKCFGEFRIEKLNEIKILPTKEKIYLEFDKFNKPTLTKIKK